MKKKFNIKGNTILGIGIIIMSISYLMSHITNQNNICDFLTGFGIGLEIVGFFKQCKENKNI